MNAPDVVVVGAGMAGLTAARDLALGGVRVTMLEASERIGGKLRAHRVGGLQLDAGAESFARRGDTVETLLRELGLSDQVVTPAQHRAWLRTADGRSLPLPTASLLGIPATPMAAEVIDVIGFTGALRAQLDSLMPGVVGSRLQKLGPLVRRRMGRRVLQELVAPVVAGVHSRHPDELDIDTVAPGLRRALTTSDSLARAVARLQEPSRLTSRVAALHGGMYRLAQEVHADLRAAGVDVRVGIGARSLAADGVTTDSGERIPARAVLASGRPSEAETAEHICLVTLVVNCAELDGAPRGTGMLVAQPPEPAPERVRAKAITHATAKWRWLAEAAGDHQHVLRLSYGGGAIDEGDTALIAQARRDAEDLLGVPLPSSAVLDAARVNWRSAPSRPPQLLAGVHTIGEANAGVGLAAVIAQARTTAGTVLSELSGDGTHPEDD